MQIKLIENNGKTTLKNLSHVIPNYTKPPTGIHYFFMFHAVNYTTKS